MSRIVKYILVVTAVFACLVVALWEYSSPFAYVNSFKAHVNVGFFHGAMLDDPAGLLEGSGKRMRHVKLMSGKELDDGALRNLIGAAYSDIRARLAPGSDSMSNQTNG